LPVTEDADGGSGDRRLSVLGAHRGGGIGSTGRGGGGGNTNRTLEAMA
jgi:hypothetical protein